jgi:AbiU2
MARHRDFLTQLENFRQEAYVAAQYLYSDMAVQHAASKSERLLSRLNLTPRFWLAHTAASQTAAYVCLGRVFDTKSRYNIDALLNAFEANLHLFSGESLAERKRDGRAEEPLWLHSYLAKAHFPNAKDVARLRAKVAAYRAVYDRAVKPARHKYLAHREKEEHMEVQALFAGGKVRELWRMVTFLHALHTALWEQYHNGRKPVLRALRFSVKTIYDAKHQRSSPHEAVIADTKKLMQFIERATPNPSIEGTASGLRPPAAPHVKR